MNEAQHDRQLAEVISRTLANEQPRFRQVGPQWERVEPIRRLPGESDSEFVERVTVAWAAERLATRA